MLEKTNMTAVCEIAKNMLRITPKETNLGKIVVDHPYTDSAYISIDGKIVDICESIENFEKYVAWMEAKLSLVRKYKILVGIIAKPYRTAFLKMTLPYIDKYDLGYALECIWKSCDYVNVDRIISRTEFVELFKEAAPETLMTEEERDILRSLPDTIEVYRGVNSVSAHPVNGLSWTRDLKKAVWFADRFRNASDEYTGEVYKATVCKKNILAYFSYEDETVVDFRKLKPEKLLF